jgi:hypothetical protein
MVLDGVGGHVHPRGERWGFLDWDFPGLRTAVHVDGVVSEREVKFADAHAYGAPPLNVSHAGGVFTTRTLERESEDAKTLQALNAKLIEVLGLVRGVTHGEFLKAHLDGKFYFQEIASRVGGAYISDLVDAANGINLWREWAKLEVGAGGTLLFAAGSARLCGSHCFACKTGRA